MRWSLARQGLAVLLLAVLAAGQDPAPAAPTDCPYNSFLDALPGGTFGDTSIFKTAVKLAGFEVRPLRRTTPALARRTASNFRPLPSLSEPMNAL